LAAHSFSTREYLREVLRPALQAGAARAGRPVPPVLLQLLVAPTRAAAATQMIAYTVPGYRRVLDHAGLGDLADRVMEASGEGRRGEAPDMIDHGCVDRLAVVGGDGLEGAIESWRPLTE